MRYKINYKERSRCRKKIEKWIKEIPNLTLEMIAGIDGLDGYVTVDRHFISFSDGIKKQARKMIQDTQSQMGIKGD